MAPTFQPAADGCHRATAIRRFGRAEGSRLSGNRSECTPWCCFFWLFFGVLVLFVKPFGTACLIVVWPLSLSFLCAFWYCFCSLFVGLLGPAFLHVVWASLGIQPASRNKRTPAQVVPESPEWVLTAQQRFLPDSNEHHEPPADGAALCSRMRSRKNVQSRRDL